MILRVENELLKLILIVKTLSHWQWEPQISVIPLTNVRAPCLGELGETQQHLQLPGVCGALEKCPGRSRSYKSWCPAFKRVISRAYVKARALDLQKGSLPCRKQNIGQSILLSPVCWGLHKCHRHCSRDIQAEYMVSPCWHGNTKHCEQNHMQEPLSPQGAAWCARKPAGFPGLLGISFTSWHPE